MRIENIELVLEKHKEWLLTYGKKGERADLEGANLRGADLREANLREAHLEGANLRGVHLMGADLREADLRGANLMGADLRGVHLRGANLREADLRGAYLPNGVYQVVGSGSTNRCTTYFLENDMVVCGCWDDEEGNTLGAFKERIESVYGEDGKEPNPLYYQEYKAAIAFFEAVRDLIRRK